MVSDTPLSARVLRDEMIFRHELEALKPIEIYFPRRPRVKILIVTDGSGSFDSNMNFGLGRMIQEMNSDPWWWVQFEMITAHRRTGTPFASTATYQDFRFNTPPVGVNLNDFDQIWLFGVERSGAFPLQPAEITVLTNYMNSGRGVFATGDHEDLGASLCGDLPRINKMRKWRTGGPAGTPPPVGGTNRHDTCREGLTPGYQFDDQEDNVPQEIIPKHYYNPWGYPFFRRRWRPHPVLCGRNGIINVLPDHMHEGWIVAPDAAAIAANPSEWPGGVGSEVIADATVIAHTNTDGSGYVSGKRFGVLGAYDGHPQGVGRIVVDATWHHWFNINLRGFDTSSSHYDKIRNYFWNVGLWLAPPAKQTAMFNAAVYGLVWLQPFNELSSKVDLIHLGFSGIDAIGRRASQCVATDWIIEYLPLKLREQFRYRPIPPNPPDPPFRGLEFVREFALGGVMRELMQAFGPDKPPQQAPELKEIAELTQRGLRAGIAEMTKFEMREFETSKRQLVLVEEVLRSID
jgi:hypothetical protein